MNNTFIGFIHLLNEWRNVPFGLIEPMLMISVFLPAPDFSSSGKDTIIHQLQGRNPNISLNSLSLTTNNQSVTMSHQFHISFSHCSPSLNPYWHSLCSQHHLSLPGKLQGPSNGHPYLQSCPFPNHSPCSARAIWKTKLKERNSYSSKPFKSSLLSWGKVKNP